MRWMSILLIFALLLSACGKPAGLENGASKELKEFLGDSGNKTQPIDNETISEPAETPKNTTESEEKKDDSLTNEKTDRIDITTSGGKGHVKGTVKGISHSFDAPYDDVDALIFDASDKWDMSLFETRYIVWINGNRYLKPTQEKATEEAIAKIEDPNMDTSGIGYVVTKDEGYLRAVGCDRDRGILTLKIHNIAEEPVPMWRDVKPRIKGAIVFRLNKVVLGTMYCENKEVLEPDTEYKCRKSGITFIEDRQTSTIHDDVDYGDVKNQIVVQRPGVTEIIDFTCPATPVKAEESVEVNTTQNSTNATA